MVSQIHGAGSNTSTAQFVSLGSNREDMIQTSFLKYLDYPVKRK
jgi:hypothetical protein